MPCACQQEQATCQSIMCISIAACATVNPSYSHVLYDLLILKQNSTKLLYLHPNLTAFTNIGRQRPLCQLLYSNVGNFLSD